MKTKIVLSLLLLLLLSSCAETVNVNQCVDHNDVYGFWGGTWHGMIATFAFVGSLFDSSIAIYAVNNNGTWYNFGYIGGCFVIIKMAFRLLEVILAVLTN